MLAEIEGKGAGLEKGHALPQTLLILMVDITTECFSVKQFVTE